MFPHPLFQFPPIGAPFPPFIDHALETKREAIRWTKEFEQRHLRPIEDTKQLVPSLVKHNLNKQQVEELLKPFKDDTVRDIIKLKIARQQRKMKWKKKKRKESREYNKQQKALGPTLEKIIDEWQRSEFLKEEDTRKRFQEEKETAARKQQSAKENKQKRELASVICRLEQLRRLRYKKKLAEGRPALDIDRFDSFLMPESATETKDRNTDKENSIENNSNTLDNTVINNSSNNNTNNTRSEENEERIKVNNNEKTATESNSELIYGRFKDEPEQFYYQAYSSIDNLIAVRKEWDRYLVAIPGTGSKIPLHFIPPPTTPNPTWARFIVNNANSNINIKLLICFDYKQQLLVKLAYSSINICLNLHSAFGVVEQLRFRSAAMDAPNIHIISTDGHSVDITNMVANSLPQLDRNPGTNFNFAPPLYPASYSNFGNAPSSVKEEVPLKLLNNNILSVQQRGILAHTHSMDELFSIKDILNGENIDANELPITDFGNHGAKNGATPQADPQAMTAAALFQAKGSLQAPVGGTSSSLVPSAAKQDALPENPRVAFGTKTENHSIQAVPGQQISYGLEAEDPEASAYEDQYNKVVPKLRFKSPKRKSPSSSEEKLVEVEEQNENDEPIVHINKKRRFNSFQYLFSPDFDDNPNQYIDVLRTKYTLPNKSNTYFEDGSKFTEISLTIRKQRIAEELTQKDQLKQVRVKKTLKAK